MMASSSTPPSSSSSLAQPKDLSHLYSRTTKNREQSNIKRFYKYFAIPGIGQLAGGLPNDHYFPYDTLEAQVALPDRWKPTPNKPVDPPAAELAATSLSDSKKKSSEPPSARVLVPKNSGATDLLKKIDLASALQYGTAQGYPPLYGWIKNFTLEVLHPTIPYADGPDVILTAGSTDGFSKIIQCFNNEWVEGRDDIKDKEGLLCEEFAYMNAIQTAKPRGMNVAPVKIDDEGMLADGPGGLEDVLKNWDEKKGRRPHLLYTVTIGQNPTSGVLSVQRRKDLYAICDKYDVIIVEDDPYWYLQYPSARDAKYSTPKPQKSSGFDFIDSLVPSYLSVDTAGRVVRIDTFSKTVAPGCRLGWITAQPRVVERILRITETSTQQPSGFVQSMIAELVMGPHNSMDPGRGGAKDGSGWKVDGWVRWLEGLRGNYERRMNAMCKILEDGKYHVKAGRRESISDEWSVIEKVQMFDFQWPMGGMFVWLRANFESHPLYKKVDPARLARALWVLWTTEPYLVLVSPGSIFSPTQEIRDEKGWAYFRLCFAAIDEDQLAPVSKRFVQGFNAFWRIKSEKTIDDLLKDDEVTMAGVPDVEPLIGPC